jgi:transcriptional regulator with XRE-family HTH domain
MTSDGNAKHLGDLIRQRRKELKLTQADIQEKGGPSTATLRLIEGGRHTDFRPSTSGPLERILGWSVGSIDTVLAGGDPTPIQPPGPPRTEGMTKEPPRREPQKRFDDYRIAELPVIYPALSRDGKLRVARLGREIFDTEYRDWTIGQINELLEAAQEQGTPGETGEDQKTLADNPQPTTADWDVMQARVEAQARGDEGFEQQG